MIQYMNDDITKDNVLQWIENVEYYSAVYKDDFGIEPLSISLPRQRFLEILTVLAELLGEQEQPEKEEVNE